MNKYVAKIIKIVIVGLLTLNIVSCSDMLDKNPLDQISSEAFWNNEKEADMALAGVYSRLYVYTFRHKDTEWDIMAGDVNGNQTMAVIDIARGNIHPTSGSLISNIFSNCYQGISGCNFFLANIDKAPILPEKLNRYKGEAQFLRALFYFTLAETYGGVPLYTTPVTIEGAKIKQSTKAEVIQQILSDLDFAIANLPNTGYTTGHAVKGTAMALKAKVLLHDAKWSEAAAVANQIITDGKFDLYSDFRKLFLASGKANNPEIMFSTRHHPDVRMDVDVRWSWHGVVNPRKELVDSYECTDGLPISSSPLYNPNNWRLNRDPRLLMTVKAFADSVTNSAGKRIGFNYNAPSTTGFNPVKYCNWDVLPIDYSTISEQDWIILRFADVLLMYAEAQNEAVGPDASVHSAVNRVRARVNMPPLPTGLTKDQMRVRIRNERRVELALEGIRWGDIKRWKTAEVYINTLEDLGGAKRVFDPAKHYLMPFPQSEIDINDNLVQNPGY